MHTSSEGRNCISAHLRETGTSRRNKPARRESWEGSRVCCAFELAIQTETCVTVSEPESAAAVVITPTPERDDPRRAARVPFSCPSHAATALRLAFMQPRRLCLAGLGVRLQLRVQVGGALGGGGLTALAGLAGRPASGGVPATAAAAPAARSSGAAAPAAAEASAGGLLAVSCGARRARRAAAAACASSAIAVARGGSAVAVDIHEGCRGRPVRGVVGSSGAQGRGSEWPQGTAPC